MLRLRFITLRSKTSIIGKMSERNEFVTVRRLPDGGVQTVRIANRAPGRLSLVTNGGDAGKGFDAGVLVEVDAPEAMYFGQVIGRQDDSLVTVAVEHFINRAALAEIEKVWKTAESA